MRVLFLDFDGVLNGTAEEATFDETLAFGSIEWLSQQYDVDKVERLNTIVEATGAVVVLSTSWRNRLPLPHLTRVMQALGFRGFVLGATPALYRTPDGEERKRHHEVQAWLDEVGEAVETFAILDDLDMGPLNERLVRTPETTGLRDEDVERAIALLR